MASSILRLLEAPGLRTQGEILWKGRDLLRMRERELQAIRGKEIAIVFQNSQASLNPALRIGTLFAALLRKHQGLSGSAAESEAIRLLEQVRLPDAPRLLRAHSYECSGGMAQRVAIALALACRPTLLILDEPTAALDATIAVQIAQLLRALKDDFGLSILLISHDFGIVARLCDRVSVMYLGAIVESAPTASLLTTPQHPYTAMLLDAALLPPFTQRPVECG